jgi:hypothetical protein
VLRAHRQRQLEERELQGPASTDSHYVFTTETGKPLHPDYVSRHVVRVQRSALWPAATA